MAVTLADINAIGFAFFQWVRRIFAKIPADRILHDPTTRSDNTRSIVAGKVLGNSASPCIEFYQCRDNAVKLLSFMAFYRALLMSAHCWHEYRHYRTNIQPKPTEAIPIHD